MQRADVAVVGGGPAGLAAALRHAAEGAAVVLLERGPADRPRFGETLGAEVAGRLVDLGLDPTPFFAGAPRFVGVHSAWGGPELVASSTLLHPLGEGWHVDRPRFDAALLDAARARGVRVLHDVGRCQILPDSRGFRVECAEGAALVAPRVVDASGRGAPASAGLAGRQWVSLDRQVALLAVVPDPGGEPVLQLEAVEAGYWYAAPLPAGRLAVVLVTDGDVLTAAGADRAERFQRLLAQAPLTRARIGGPVDAPIAAGRSDSGWLLPPDVAGFQAAGDAGLATDPLGGDGVARALVAPLDAAAAARRRAAFLGTRARYYLAEDRWPMAPFWARRRPLDPAGLPADPATVPLTLRPDARLRWQGEAPAAVEAWLPRAAVRAVELALQDEAPAHAALAAARAAAPVGDRRLLAGLQWLCGVGVVAAA